MKKLGLLILGGILVLIFLVGGALVGLYNRLVTLDQEVANKQGQIEVVLQRRFDLIPNLVNTVKGYATHERELLEKVTEARTRAMGAQGVHDKAVAENMLSQTLKSLFAVAENYPDLKASQNFLELQRELRDTEDKIQAARRFYNTNVMSLNTKIEVFPSNLIARGFGFKKEEFFELEDVEQREAPKVSF